MSPSFLTLYSRFIGRAHELSELRALLRTERLIALTGLGGSGKTRLVLQLAQASPLILLPACKGSI